MSVSIRVTTVSTSCTCIFGSQAQQELIRSVNETLGAHLISLINETTQKISIVEDNLSTVTGDCKYYYYAPATVID